MITIKRVYEPARKQDGYRVLVDRLWPRGITHAAAKIDDWAKEISPSHELRRRFDHDPAHWNQFREDFLDELHTEPARAKLKALAALGRHQTVTLIYAAHDEEHNNAVVLKQVLDRLQALQLKPQRKAA